ncbi:Uncharacterised protein [Mycobacteroides abscessus subsp. abscessus]|nr:Uncharacterised protein [Mycobacteroides abscessus subsp. abscessus]
MVATMTAEIASSSVQLTIEVTHHRGPVRSPRLVECFVMPPLPGT